MTADHARAQAEIRLTLALTVSLVLHAALVALGQSPATSSGRPLESPTLSVSLDARPRPVPPSAPEALAVPAPPRARARAGTEDEDAVGWATRPHYFTAAQLEERPRPLTPIALPEPADPLSAGYVVVRLRIAETGVVDDATVLVDDAPARTAARIAAVFGAARYAPGLRKGQAVKSELLIEVKIAPAG